MKKSLVCLILAAVLLLLCGCAAVEDAAAQIVDLGILERKPDLCGRWCVEVKIHGDNNPIFPNELQIFEDMTYAFGQQKGRVILEEEENQVFLENGEDEIIYYTFTVTEEDGFTKLLDESESCYVREEEHAAALAKKAARMPDIYGQWRMELYTGSTEKDYFANELQIFEDMTYAYGWQKGAVCFDETGKNMYFINGEDGVRYFEFAILEEDGFTKLLCDGQYFYVRDEDYKDALAKKYVTLWRHNDLSEYFAQTQYIGNATGNVGYGENAPVCMLASLAYDRGLIYVGSFLDFQMEVDREMKNGQVETRILCGPFEFMKNYEGSKLVRAEITSGMMCFIREEYVKEVVIRDEMREVVLKTGPVMSADGGAAWGHFPEGTYDNFKY